MEQIMKKTIELALTEKLHAPATLAGRILLASIFIIAGAGKITGYAGTQGYMEAFGVPGGLLPLVILFEILAGVALAIGFQTRLVAFLLAGFSLVSALIFHFNLADQVQFLLFTKNMAIAGGLLSVAAHGAGAYSMDKK